MNCDPSPPGDGEQEAERPSHFEPPRPKMTVERVELDLSRRRAKTKENECMLHSYDAAGKKEACSQQGSQAPIRTRSLPAFLGPLLLLCFLAGVVFGRGGRENARPGKRPHLRRAAPKLRV